LDSYSSKEPKGSIRVFLIHQESFIQQPQKPLFFNFL